MFKYGFITLVFVLFFVTSFGGVRLPAQTGEGVLIPQTNYFLESDDDTVFVDRPYYAYTPQPDWNAAYDFIEAEREEDDIIISSHPHFSYLFLGQSGYWLPIDYLGDNEDRRPLSSLLSNNSERYVGASIIPDPASLESLTQRESGFLIFDYQAWDGRIPEDILDYIDEELSLVFYEETNSYSKIWVYTF